IISICACGCGRTFSKFDNKLRERRFISGHNNKKKEGTHLRIELICQFCKKVFIGYPSNSSKKYCSMTCKVKASTGVLLTEDGRISSSGNGYSTIVKRNHHLADSRGNLISQTTVEDCSTRAERDRLSVIKDALQRIFLWSANSNHTWLLK